MPCRVIQHQICIHNQFSLSLSWITRATTSGHKSQLQIADDNVNIATLLSYDWATYLQLMIIAWFNLDLQWFNLVLVHSQVLHCSSLLHDGIKYGCPSHRFDFYPTEKSCTTSAIFDWQRMVSPSLNLMAASVECDVLMMLFVFVYICWVIIVANTNCKNQHCYV